MLIEFRVENHRSLRDEQVLTMEAGRVGDESDSRPRRITGYSEPLLPVAVLYGANASGKSNVLAALRFMADAVIESQRAWPPDGGVPRDPFAWSRRAMEPSLFEVAIVVDAVRYEYGFTASDDCFLEEWLHAWPSGKKQTWFERENNNFKFGDHLQGENKVIEEVTRPNALFLSAAVQFRHQQLQPIYRWFRGLVDFNVVSRAHNMYRRKFVWRAPTELVVERLLDESVEPVMQQRSFLSDESTDAELLERFNVLLRNADFGIVDLRVNKPGDDDSSRRRSSRIQLKHQSGDEDSWLWLDEESKGTQTLFRMGLPILKALRRGGLVIVDELESSLHPMLAHHIVRQFNDLESNPRNAQLIFTTHDTNLIGNILGEPPVRRDQVWFTEKAPGGETVIYPLTDYKPRKNENLERGYLQGRYGAIPFLGSAPLFEE